MERMREVFGVSASVATDGERSGRRKAVGECCPRLFLAVFLDDFFSCQGGEKLVICSPFRMGLECLARLNRWNFE